MRLTVPEPKIELYKDGFDEHDQLSRKPTGEKLSDLVERIDDPLVIALDGSWGSGKSFFLKCWVGEHLQRKGKTTQTVYFDAFKHDFLDDPLIALTDAIAARFEKNEKLTSADSKAKTGKIKKVAWLLGKSGLKIGASLATFGAANQLEELGDAVATAVGDETKALLDSNIGDAESDSFWAAQRAKIAAMEAFKQALVELTEPATEADVKKALEADQKLKKGDPTQKLVIVIDELDRCRPDYALSLLEIIKHFFNVNGVHFVLGVNLKELQNSVRARYGNGVDAEKYLQKFIHLTMQMSEMVSTDRTSHKNDQSQYFSTVAKQLGLPEEGGVGKTVFNILEGICPPSLNLREVEQIASRCSLVPEIDDFIHGYVARVLISTLIILRVSNSKLFEKAVTGNIQLSELCSFFNIPEDEGSIIRTPAVTIWAIWAHCCGQKVNAAIVIEESNRPNLSLEDYDENSFKRLSEQYISRFSFYGNRRD